MVIYLMKTVMIAMEVFFQMQKRYVMDLTTIAMVKRMKMYKSHFMQIQTKMGLVLKYNNTGV